MALGEEKIYILHSSLTSSGLKLQLSLQTLNFLDLSGQNSGKQTLFHLFFFFNPGRVGFLGGHRQNNSICGSLEHSKFSQPSYKVRPS